MDSNMETRCLAEDVPHPRTSLLLVEDIHHQGKKGQTSNLTALVADPALAYGAQRSGRQSSRQRKFRALLQVAEGLFVTDSGRDWGFIKVIERKTKPATLSMHMSHGKFVHMRPTCLSIASLPTLRHAACDVWVDAHCEFLLGSV